MSISDPLVVPDDIVAAVAMPKSLFGRGGGSHSAFGGVPLPCASRLRPDVLCFELSVGESSAGPQMPCGAG